MGAAAGLHGGAARLALTVGNCREAVYPCSWGCRLYLRVWLEAVERRTRLGSVSIALGNPLQTCPGGQLWRLG